MPAVLRAPVQKLHPLSTGATVFGASFSLFAAALLLACPVTRAQSTPTVAAPISAPAIPTAPAAAKPAIKPASAPASAARVSKEALKSSGWAELNPAQQQALKPLAANWKTLSEAQKRKWLALSQNYPSLPPAEQAKLHSRMTEWVSLSPQQRTQARLNFAETKTLSPDDKKAKWEAYQALSPEEKKKLAAAQAKPPATAAAIKPVPAQKLATIPKTQPPEHKPPRIAVAPNQVDHNTLLPQPHAVPAAAPSN